MPSFLKSGVVPDAVSAQPPYIPRILWQTAEHRDRIHPRLVTCMDALKAMNPTWEYRFFDDAARLQALRAVCSDRFMRAYLRIQPRYGAARADLFRYVMVYLHGGAYLDLKSGTTRPLDEILRPEDRFIISQWDNGPDGKFPKVGLRKSLNIEGGEYEQWFVIAQPGHPFLAAVLEKVLRNIETYNPFRFGVGGEGVLKVTGPDAYTCTIHAIENGSPHRRICAYDDGLKYTMLEDLFAHRRLDDNHYNKLNLAPVTGNGLTVSDLLRLKVLSSLYLLFDALRTFNRKRLNKRHAKKAEKEAGFSSKAGGQDW